MTEPEVFPYRLLRSDRRTLSLTLDERGGLTAHAPRRMPVYEIERFIAQKSGWLRQKQAQLDRRAEELRRYGTQEGGVLPYLGRELRVTRAGVARPEERDGVLMLPLGGDGTRQALRWYTAQAEKLLPARTEEWARRMGVYPASIAFGHARKRWGSMAANGALRLNIGLLHCPPELIDYVIVHELAHRVHPDHSPAFHAYVESVLPGAAQLRRRMKDMGPWLALLREPGRKGEQ